ncbi:MAG TPA: MFS transporter [Bacillales bacterium]|nr:MFS transporter [Bacillales bacterium]
MEEKKTWDLISISSIPLVMTLGNSMLIPVLPTIEKELHISSLQSSLIITVYSVVAILLIPVAGYLSDRLGRKKIIIPSLIIAGVGGLISGFASWLLPHPYWLILVGRLLQGVGASGAFPVVLPLVGDMFKNEQEVSSSLGMVETSNTFGKVVSPILGGFLASLIWFLPFLSIPLFCLISVLLVLFLVKTPQKQEEPQPFKEFLQSVKQIFGQKGRWLYAVFLIGAIFMFVLFGVLFFLSTVLQDHYGIKGTLKGLILAAPLLALSLTAYITGKKIGQNKPLMKKLTLIGCALLAATILCVSFIQQITMFIVVFVAGGVGIGLVLPCLDAFITEGIEKEQRGTVSSIYSSMRFIGVALGPPLFAMLMKLSHKTLFLSITGVCIVAVLLALWAIKPAGQVKKERLKPIS